MVFPSDPRTKPSKLPKQSKLPTGGRLLFHGQRGGVSVSGLVSLFGRQSPPLNARMTGDCKEGHKAVAQKHVPKWRLAKWNQRLKPLNPSS